MRDIKFRFWNEKESKMFTLEEMLNLHDVYCPQCGLYLPPVLDFNLEEFLSKGMQFTSLADKNGKEIYEGDILKRPDSETNYIAVFNGGCFCIQDSENKHHNLTLLDGISIFLEITGNIYENPELLEAKE